MFNNLEHDDGSEDHLDIHLNLINNVDGEEESKNQQPQLNTMKLQHDRRNLQTVKKIAVGMKQRLA